MVPRITSKGRSFKGAGAYFLHDLGQADTSERVAFTHTVNMLTNDPETAIKVMAWTAAHADDLKIVSGQKATGRKAQNPVYNYCLAWAPDQDPSDAEMISLGLRSMETLGVSDHEALFVAHNDTPHKHLHVILNRVHPETGLMAKMSHDQNLLSRLGQAYEEETGHIYCAQRVENNRRRDLGDPRVKAAPEPRLMETEAYQARRAARVEAQRQAAAHALAREDRAQVDTRLARDLRAAFDQSAAHDDLQYRARELTPDPKIERVAAAAAWQDERRVQARQQREQVDGQRVAREAARRAQREARRDALWERYETGQWQRLNDRHTARWEALNDRLQGMQARFHAGLDLKYRDTQAFAQRDVQRLEERLDRGRLQAAVDRLTGKDRDLSERLAEAKAAAERIAARKQQELDGYLGRLQGQREAEQARQAADRETLSFRLEQVKARQSAAFEAREAAWATRQSEMARPPAPPKEQRREAVRQVEQQHVRQMAEGRALRARLRDLPGPQQGRAPGRGRGLSY